MYIGTAAGLKPVRNPVVGTATGNKPVNKVWVGTSGGNKLVWQRWTSSTTLTATVASTRQINLSWTATPGATYQLFRTQGHTTGPLTGVTSSLSYSDTGLAEGTAYSYRVDVIFEGKVQGSATASATTGVTPPPQYETRYFQGYAINSATWNGSGANRNVSECYYGRYSSTNGLQKSLIMFQIPPDMRNCHRILSIDIAVWNTHHYSNAGGTVGLVVHHSPVFGAAFPGSTDRFLNAAVPKTGWVGKPADGWLSVGDYTTPGRTTVKEEFRVNGAWGFGLAAVSTSDADYGYAMGYTQANRPQMRAAYEVRL